jgi:hypothetical protein
MSMALAATMASDWLRKRAAARVSALLRAAVGLSASARAASRALAPIDAMTFAGSCVSCPPTT